jgi:hypothetical protein
MQAIYYKRWLDKNRYYYRLSVPAKYWKFNYVQLSKELSQILGRYDFIKILNKDYYIYLSPLGIYGNYKLPNTVHVNIQRDSEEIAKTIMHEIIHLMVELDVIKLKLSHDEKEILVESKYKELVG